ncbi:MAG: hypothetical protein GX848_06925 [Clostridiales bacterium]|nr:hypothetical protein [Clostridiales bacterium]
MKIKKAIEYADSYIKNDIDAAVKKFWLRELDGDIMQNLFSFYKEPPYNKDNRWAKHILHYLGKEREDSEYTEDDFLLIRFPFDGIYVHYLCMRMYLAFNELTRYENEQALFNESLKGYKDYINRSQTVKKKTKFTIGR